MIFSATKKVLDKSSKVYPISAITPPHDLWNWYVNVVPLANKSGLIFVNAASLYAILIPSTTLPVLRNLESVFMERLKNSLEEAGFESKKIQLYFNQKPALTFTKTLNRSLIGTMNEMVIQMEYMSKEHQLEPEKIQYHINKHLFGNKMITGKSGVYVVPGELMEEALNNLT